MPVQNERMTAMLILSFIVLIIVLVVLAYRNMNQGYTVGSGLFKRSDNNLEKDEHIDVSDYDYYNTSGKMK